MTQVSKYPLSKDIEERIFVIFWKTLARLTTVFAIKKFFEDLLSSSERTMLAKRLAIALLLAKNYDYGSIKKILKVSDGTIAKVQIWLKHGGEGYKMAINSILKDEKMKEFWQKVEDALIETSSPLGIINAALRDHRAKRKPKGSLG